jgi:Flp pilus assembly protein TadG
MTFLRRLPQDEDGGPLVEAAVLIPFLTLFLFGAVDFLFAMNDWNDASKAVELGARLAAVSNPVSDGLAALSQNVLSSSVLPGAAWTWDYKVTCDGNAQTCACSGGGCSGYTATFDLSALKTIVYGRGNTGSCNSSAGIYFAGMCGMYSGLLPANVVVTYTQCRDGSGNNTCPSSNTGLGYAGRPGGPVPTVQVSLQGLNFRFFFLNGLMGFGSIPLPITASKPTTMTGEVLCSDAQAFTGDATTPACQGGA